MSGLSVDDLPYEARSGLENVRKLEIIYKHRHPGEGTCVVEYVGGQVELFEVNRFLLEQLLEHLKHREG